MMVNSNKLKIEPLRSLSQARGLYSLPHITKRTLLRKRFHPKSRLQVRHDVAQEMGVGPSEPVCRSWLQTTLSCNGKEPLW